MKGPEPSSAWARRVFGELVGPLTQAIPECLVRAHERARDGHQGVHTQTLEAYGHGLYAVQYEELLAGLRDLPSAQPVRLGSRTVTMVGEHMLYPLRYAKTDVPVTEARLRRATGLRADLIRHYGPEPLQGELDLEWDEMPEPEVHRDLTRLPPGTKLILLAYACSMERGVIRLEWGEAELRAEDRYLIWHHHEPLPLGNQQGSR